MSSKRELPTRHNPLLEAEHTPQLEILIERRRLGQTDLAVKPGQVGITNATKEQNLGKFDYAHLRAPLPKDLKDSGIFSIQKGAYPESYFLMRRSNDGFISATGMFKAAFPWASVAEEQAERKYHKTFSSAGLEEVAGNVWVSPSEALELATEYNMRPWIVALLDPEPIDKGTKEKGTIHTPPKFIVPDKGNIVAPSPTPTGSTRPRRTRELRSASPSKIASPARKMATPRKARTTRSKKADAAALENGTQDSVKGSIAGSVEPESVNGEVKPVTPVEPASLDAEPTSAPAVQPVDTVTISVDQVEQADTTQTSVRVELPADHPDMSLPESPEEMLATAKKMVEEANKLEGQRRNSIKALKRKADDVEEDDEGKVAIQPVKKIKQMEDDAKRARVTARASIGLATVAFMGAAFTYFW